MARWLFILVACHVHRRGFVKHLMDCFNSISLSPDCHETNIVQYTSERFTKLTRFNPIEIMNQDFKQCSNKPLNPS